MIFLCHVSEVINRSNFRDPEPSPANTDLIDFLGYRSKKRSAKKIGYLINFYSKKILHKRIWKGSCTIDPILHLSGGSVDLLSDFSLTHHDEAIAAGHVELSHLDLDDLVGGGHDVEAARLDRRRRPRGRELVLAGPCAHCHAFCSSGDTLNENKEEK